MVSHVFWGVKQIFGKISQIGKIVEVPVSRRASMNEPKIEVLVKANEFRESMKPRADAWDGQAPLWHGWVIMDAFLAGYQAALADFRESVHE